METPVILFEDEHCVIISKRPGDLVAPDKAGSASLREELQKRASDPVFLEPVHRLDRPASGAVLYAKSREAFTRFSGLFQNRAMKKIYWAVTEKAPARESGRLVHAITTSHRINKSFAGEILKKTDSDAETPEGETDKTLPEAILDYRVVGKSDRYWFLEIILSTGRQHQIRAQLAAAAAIIKGDVKYGARRGNPDRSIHLHARSLSFRHPFSNAEISVTAPVPDDVLWKMMEELAK